MSRLSSSVIISGLLVDDRVLRAPVLVPILTTTMMTTTTPAARVAAATLASSDLLDRRLDRLLHRILAGGDARFLRREDLAEIDLSISTRGLVESSASKPAPLTASSSPGTAWMHLSAPLANRRSMSGSDLCGNQNFTARSLLDGVAMPVPHRSTEPARPRQRTRRTG